jgi:hypothetical protein
MPVAPGGFASLSARKFVPSSSPRTSKSREAHRNCVRPLARRSEMLARHRLNSPTISSSRARPARASRCRRICRRTSGDKSRRRGSAARIGKDRSGCDVDPHMDSPRPIQCISLSSSKGLQGESIREPRTRYATQRQAVSVCRTSNYGSCRLFPAARRRRVFVTVVNSSSASIPLDGRCAAAFVSRQASLFRSSGCSHWMELAGPSRVV